MREELSRIARENNGYVTTSAVTNVGIARRELAEAVDRGELVRVGRGIYATSDAWEDEFALTQHRFSRGIYSHETALYLNGLTDRVPDALTMTFPRGYNTSSALRTGVDARTIDLRIYGLGTTKVTTPYGNTVACHGPERAICDLFRSQPNVDLQLAIPSMRTYLAGEGRNVVRLMEYARAMGVEARVRPYVEAML